MTARAALALPTPHPLGAHLPGLYHEPDLDAVGVERAPLARRFLDALDEVLAPVFAALDNLPAYFDAHMTPPDFLDWLGGWIGLTLDETWPLERRRELLARAVRLYGQRGTAAGVAEYVRAYTGVEPVVEESGGVAWSTTGGSALPGGPVARLTVRVAVPDPAAVDRRRLEALVESVKPAHVSAVIEVVTA